MRSLDFILGAYGAAFTNPDLDDYICIHDIAEYAGISFEQAHNDWRDLMKTDEYKIIESYLKLTEDLYKNTSGEYIAIAYDGIYNLMIQHGQLAYALYKLQHDLNHPITFSFAQVHGSKETHVIIESKSTYGYLDSNYLIPMTVSKPKNPPRTHRIKLDEKFREPVLDRLKTFEIRKNDRGYKVGDYVLMYSGIEFPIAARIEYLTEFAQQDGYVVFSIKLLDNLDVPWFNSPELG